ncbi:KRAB-A domain-containing protein 2-like, partial [Acyrthosiphon pisum]|uniref:Integrase catalytic domain-containing protein n=1 Tax=Acyrthosiphon pisum TaxID=7029 RepID=A0A8R2NW64_ACYPI
MEEKNVFYEKLDEYYKLKSKKKPFPKYVQLQMIAEIEMAKIKTGKKDRRQYYLLSTYDVLSVAEEKFLIHKQNAADEKIRYLVCYEDLFDKIKEFHIRTGHGGNVKLRNALHDTYYVPRPPIDIFLTVCETCNCKKPMNRKLVIKPITTADFNERAQIDLVDFQSVPDGKFKWILNYQDHATKFVILRPLESKRATEVANELLSILLTFGAPKILQSDNGREFVNSVINELKDLWPECVIVHGRPRHPQSQGSIERSNQDIEHMLRTWMADNKSKKWSVGLNFVQFQKNSSFHRTIGRSPYKALFGNDPKIGLSTSNLPSDLLKKLTTEEDLEHISQIKEIKKRSIACSICKVDVDLPLSEIAENNEIICQLCDQAKNTNST